ncbi:MAG: ArsR/SmtB family transcription factor [Thermovenabulum sp.]|uniref:ArsR/SmtB family transcription factor n=1 Tax=Thermovenabulum sp. TaxID=3100335 RepID=UPI003C7AC8B5
MDKQEFKKKIEKTAEIFKALGHPARLCIVCKLMCKDCNVTELQDCLDLPQSTVSQHLSALKSKGIIKGKRAGVEVIYSVVNEDVKKIVKMLLKLDENQQVIKSIDEILKEKVEN